MRNVAAAFLAVPIACPTVVAAAPPGAAGETSWRTANGSANCTPALSKRKLLVLSTVKSGVINLGGCAGEVLKPGTYTTLATSKTSTRTKGTEAWTWNTKQTSMIALTSTGGAGATETHAKLAGCVTAGACKGLKLSGSFSVRSRPAHVNRLRFRRSPSSS